MSGEQRALLTGAAPYDGAGQQALIDAVTNGHGIDLYRRI